MKHDTTLPTQPHPFYSYLLYFLRSILHYISHIFSSWNSNCLGPCVFFSHIKIQKSHIIKTHNCCESIKRELEQNNYFWSSLANVLYISVFTLQPDGESTESLPVLNVWLIGEIQGRSTTRQVYKINPSSSCVLFKGDQMGRGKKEKSHRRKEKDISREILFFLQGFAKVIEKKRKNHFFFFCLHL